MSCKKYIIPIILFISLFLVSVPGQSVTPCTDSDGGYYPDKFGTVSWTDANGAPKTTPDTCVGSSVMEAVCDSSGYANNAQTFNCPNGCSNGACVQAPQPSSCDPLDEAYKKDCEAKGYTVTTKTYSISGCQYYYCPTSSSTCPPTPTTPRCNENEKPQMFYDSKSCPYYECTSNTSCSPLNEQDKEVCSKYGATDVEIVKDSRGCEYYKCKYDRNCPSIEVLDCKQGYYPKTTKYDENNCPVSQECVPYQSQCPDIQYSIDKCKRHGGEPVFDTYENGDLECKYISDCRTEQKCPIYKDSKAMERKCIKSGGKFYVENKGDCKLPRCDLPETDKCPTPQDNQDRAKKCEDLGLTVSYKLSGNCKYAICESDVDICPKYTDEIVGAIKDKCIANGLDYDYLPEKRGEAYCKVLQCLDKKSCEKEVPEEFEKSCQEKDGKVIIDKAKNGCIKFDCVSKQDQVAVDPVTKRPDSAKLLALVLKLEGLKLEFDKLYREIKSISDYYTSTGDTDKANKFEKIANIFLEAKNKVSDVENKLKDKLQNKEDLDLAYLTDIRAEIKTIAEVTLNNALFAMLEVSEEAVV